jgi:hypothetical protein
MGLEGRVLMGNHYTVQLVVSLFLVWRCEYGGRQLNPAAAACG